MRIGIDAMGGDFAPLECIKGALLFYKQFPANIQIVLFGDETKINTVFKELGEKPDCIEVVHCPEVIDMAESPTKAFSTKPNSSIAVGFNYLKEGKIDSFASAGNTGAMLVGAMYSVKPIQGVMRPAISALVPRMNGKKAIILDVGVNADCKPEMLNQFALLGSLYLEHVYKVPNPRIGLLNIGEEEGKGNKLTQETYPMMKENDKINFIGNVEGRNIFSDMAEVIVCDGFTGNVILKFGESFYDLINARKIQDKYFDQFNFENSAGTAILGVNAPVVVAHGISNDLAFKSILLHSKEIIESNLVEILKQAFINNQILQD